MNNIFGECEVLVELEGFFGVKVGDVSLICSTPYIYMSDKADEKEPLESNKGVKMKKREKKVPLMLIPYRGTPLAHEKRIKRRRLDLDVEEINYDVDEKKKVDPKVGMETKKKKGGKGNQQIPLMLIPYKGTPLAHEKQIKRRCLNFDVNDVDESKNEESKKYGAKRLRMDD